jgi:outer membrane protein OmpA-like peptidoglycan-associated protein
MNKIAIILLIMIYNPVFCQMINIDKKEITPRNVSEIGGICVYDSLPYLLLPANIRYEGKAVEASEAKVISQKYRVWEIFKLNEETNELANVSSTWNLADASPNGFCLIDDSTVVYTNNKSQLASNHPAFSKLFLKSNNSKYHFTDPAWDKKHKRLYFSSDRPGGRGGMDGWYIETEGDNAGIPVNAGAMNSEMNELSITCTNDSLLFFVSNNGRQQYDIFIHNTASVKTISPEPTVGINEFFTSSNGMETLYFVTSTNKKQSLWKGKVTIRQIENMESIAPAVVEEIPETEPETNPEKIEPQEELNEDPDFRTDNYFGLAKYTLTQEMKDSLNKIVVMLIQNPSLNIVICGHSSPDGPEDKNMLLSSLRANEAYNWLIAKSINSKRIFRIYGGEYLYSNMMFSRMFSIFTIIDTDELPAEMAVVPTAVLGSSEKVYPTYGTDNDEAEYWRYILKKQLPVDDKSLLLLPIKNMHYVKAGETLYSLSRLYGSTVEKMIAANGLKDNTVPTGKILYVPAK